jgi:hypothetical protein
MPTRYEYPDALAIVVPASTTGSSTTAPVSIGGFSYAGLVLPAVFNSTQVLVKVGPTSTAVYDAYTDAGAQYVAKVGTSRFVALDTPLIQVAEFVSFVFSASTSGEAAQRTVQLMLKG